MAMNKRRPVLAWVDPEFHKMLKVESSMQGISIIRYTKSIAEENKERQAQPVESVNGFQVPKRKWKFEL